MRRDVFVENDSGGASVLSSSVVPRAIEDGRANDAGFADRDEAILLMLAGDDSFIARVIVGESLSAAEQAQWVCRVRRRLHVPCGRLLLCAGFDPDCLQGWLDGDERPTVREVAVPPGTYLADIYTHAPTMTARVLREQWQDKLGTWFRRAHPKAAFPSWVAAELVREPSDDPGHERAWRDLPKAGLHVDTDVLDWVGYVIHLQPDQPGAKLTAHEDGWLPMDAEFRQPQEFPLGLAAIDATDPEVRSELSDLLGPPKPRRDAVPDDDERELAAAIEADIAATASAAFTRIELARRDGVDAKRLAQFDASFRAVGLEPFGDIQFDFVPQLGVRVYGAPSSYVYGSLMWPDGGDPQVDFYTTFDDGSSVTTTTSPHSESIAAAKIFRTSHPGGMPQQLWLVHASAIARRTGTGAKWRMAEPTLEAFARAVDEFYARERDATTS